MDTLTLFILIAIGLLVIIGITIFSLWRYEVSIFLVGLSPWLSAVFIPNRYQDLEETGMGSFLRIGLLMLMGGVGTVQFFKMRYDRREKVPFHLKLLGIFLLFTLLSTSYSIDPKYTFIRSISFFALFGYLLGLHIWLKDDDRFRRTMSSLFWLIFILTVVNFISIVIFPGKAWWWNIETRFQGLWGHPNMMGSFCMIAYPVVLWKYETSHTPNKWITLLIIFLLGIMHLLSGSRASLIASFLGISVWFLIRKKNVKFLIVIGTLGILVLLIMTVRPSSFQREEGAALTDLTQREEFWEGSYTLIMDKPLWGYGYGVEGKVWEDTRFYRKGESLWSGSARTSLHNGFLSMTIGLGIPLVVIWCIILLIPLFRFGAISSNTYKAFAYTVWGMCFLLNFVESVLTGTGSMMVILFWIAWTMAIRLPRDEIGTNKTRYATAF